MLIRKWRCEWADQTAGFRQTRAQSAERLFDSRKHLPGHGRRGQTLGRSGEEIVPAYISETRQGVAGSRLTERETIGGSSDAAMFVNSLEDRQQIEINAAQVEHDRCHLRDPRQPT